MAELRSLDFPVSPRRTPYYVVDPRHSSSTTSSGSPKLSALLTVAGLRPRTIDPRPISLHPSFPRTNPHPLQPCAYLSRERSRRFPGDDRPPSRRSPRRPRRGYRHPTRDARTSAGNCRKGKRGRRTMHEGSQSWSGGQGNVQEAPWVMSQSARVQEGERGRAQICAAGGRHSTALLRRACNKYRI